jgi:hypothetical protein
VVFYQKTNKKPPKKTMKNSKKLVFFLVFFYCFFLKKNTKKNNKKTKHHQKNKAPSKRIAGKRKWLSRQAHNLKAVGSSPTPATNYFNCFFWCVFFYCKKTIKNNKKKRMYSKY